MYDETAQNTSAVRPTHRSARVVATPTVRSPTQATHNGARATCARGRI